MTTFCYLNGKIIPLSEAHVSLNDIGLLRGFGIYDGMITCNRKPFMPEAHLARLKRSAEKMVLKIPASDKEIEEAITELVSRNVPEGKEALIRIIITGGETVGVIEYDYEKPTMFILVGEFIRPEAHYFENGCSVSLVEYDRDLAEIKSVNYIKAVLLQKQRKAEGVLEMLFMSGGMVFEGTGSNFFIVKNRVLITPKDGIVLGITRKVVIDLARPFFKIEERAVSVQELYAADEVFISGSFKDIVPVVKIGDRIIADGKVGKVTKDVMRLFREFTRNY